MKTLLAQLPHAEEELLLELLSTSPHTEAIFDLTIDGSGSCCSTSKA
jgi:hypothetical protein